MGNSSSFVEHAVELLSSLGPVGARAMFGGHLLTSRGLSVGLVDDDRLYLKVDDATRAEFQAAGSEPFVYESRDGPMTMNGYWSLPEEAVDDPDTAAKWARLAGEAAARADAEKRAKGAGAKKKTQARKKAPAKKAKKATRAEKRG